MSTAVGGTVWEQNGVGPSGANNRLLALPASATNLDVVYFNNITNVSSIIVKPVTFSVNVGVRVALGSFDPASGTVSVAGDPLNNWSSTASLLTNSLTSPNIFQGTFNVTNTPGNTISYKFVLNGATWEDNGVGAGTQNRQFIFQNATTNLPTAFFNNISNLGAITNAYSAGQMNLSWTAGANVRLQQSTKITGGWQDVADTLGAGSAALSVGAGTVFFRLVGP